MSKENENLNDAENSALNIADVGGSIFFNVPLIAYIVTGKQIGRAHV